MTTTNENDIQRNWSNTEEEHQGCELEREARMTQDGRDLYWWSSSAMLVEPKILPSPGSSTYPEWYRTIVGETRLKKCCFTSANSSHLLCFHFLSQSHIPIDWITSPLNYRSIGINMNYEGGHQQHRKGYWPRVGLFLFISIVLALVLMVKSSVKEIWT